LKGINNGNVNLLPDLIASLRAKRSNLFWVLSGILARQQFKT
jgi:hypothetical protein